MKKHDWWINNFRYQPFDTVLKKQKTRVLKVWLQTHLKYLLSILNGLQLNFYQVYSMVSRSLIFHEDRRTRTYIKTNPSRNPLYPFYWFGLFLDTLSTTSLDPLNTKNIMVVEWGSSVGMVFFYFFSFDVLLSFLALKMSQCRLYCVVKGNWNQINF